MNAILTPDPDWKKQSSRVMKGDKFCVSNQSRRGAKAVADSTMPTWADIIAIGVALTSGGVTYGALSQRIKNLENLALRAKDTEDEMLDLRDRMVRVEEGVKHANETLGEIKRQLQAGSHTSQKPPSGH